MTSPPSETSSPSPDENGRDQALEAARVQREVLRRALERLSARAPAPDDVQVVLGSTTGLKKKRASDVRKSSKPETVRERLDDIRVTDQDQNVALKKLLARGSFIAVALQLAVANVAFYIYGFYKDWDVEPEVMITWLSATVVETIGVILIIARHLFPRTDAPSTAAVAAEEDAASD